ncbi:hypothetical protein HAZT_HAZT004250 [Hyalella azteca]|uniref:LITAF domain-containing protein n=1 Tax=Hyalella azteca TaxID=294128 RepID=A0A6A0GSF2_HYAAZ|nr:hypothetical protein HAZT_HAZT004250 [Hyalella azteca]
MFDGHLSGLVPQENMNITPFEELRMEDVHTPGRLFKCPVCEKILADKYMFRGQRICIVAAPSLIAFLHGFCTYGFCLLAGGVQHSS